VGLLGDCNERDKDLFLIKCKQTVSVVPLRCRGDEVTWTVTDGYANVDVTGRMPHEWLASTLLSMSSNNRRKLAAEDH